MTSANLVGKFVIGGGMLIGLSLLSQPAQAILVWNFSYTAPTGTGTVSSTLTTDGTSYATNTIYNLVGMTGTVTKNATTQTITGITASNPGINIDNKFVWDGGTGILLTSNGLAFRDASPLDHNLYSNSGGTGSTLSSFSSANLRNFSIQTNGSNSTPVFGDASVTALSLTPTAVPWETDALSVVGSTVLFAGSLWARNKFAKPLQK